MQEVTTRSQNKSNESTSSNKKTSWAISAIRDTFITCIWVYAVVKIFVFDIDTFLIESYAPDFAWILDYKFFIIIGIFAIFVLFSNKKRVFISFLYIFLYPIILLFWRIPYIILRNKRWTLALSIVESFISFFRSFKYNVAVIALWLIAFVLLLTSSNHEILYAGSVVLLALLLLTYVQRLIQIFKPGNLFQIYTKVFEEWRTYVESTWKLDDAIKALPVSALEERQLNKWASNLELTVLCNRVAVFAAKRLRDYQNSNIASFSSAVMTTFFLIIITVTSFAAINFALYKVDAQLFLVHEESNFFQFFYYSFKTLFFSSISEISPAAPLTQILSMLENILSFFLGTILVSLALSVKTKRYSNELSQAIYNIEGEGQRIESFIQDEYKLRTIDEAMSELERLKTGLVKVLAYLTRNL